MCGLFVFFLLVSVVLVVDVLRGLFRCVLWLTETASGRKEFFLWGWFCVGRCIINVVFFRFFCCSFFLLSATFLFSFLFFLILGFSEREGEREGGKAGN